MISIGLTGGIGTGKSMIAHLFNKQGIFVLEADAVIHRLLKQNSEVWHTMVSLFGKKILFSDTDEIDREALARIVFESDKKLETLLTTLYPLLKKVLQEEMQMVSKKGGRHFLFDASQILEAGWEGLFDAIILVQTDFDIRMKRLLKRGGIDVNQIKARSYFQWPDWVKERYADFLIDNSGSLEETEKLVQSILEKIF